MSAGDLVRQAQSLARGCAAQTGRGAAGFEKVLAALEGHLARTAECLARPDFAGNRGPLYRELEKNWWAIVAWLTAESKGLPREQRSHFSPRILAAHDTLLGLYGLRAEV